MDQPPSSAEPGRPRGGLGRWRGGLGRWRGGFGRWRGGLGRPRRGPTWARWGARHRGALLWLALGAVLVAAGLSVPFAWTRDSAAGYLHTKATAPRADVVIVFGAELTPDHVHPMPFLANRLDTTAQLVKSGAARVVLISGDGHGASGDETAVMANYLHDVLGIERGRLVLDPYGLDTYDTCARARQVYGIRRALLVTQAYHLPRAVTLCRRFGIDAAGVAAGCAGCQRITLAYNWTRDFLACSKAALDAARDRPPAVSSPPNRAITDALAAIDRS